MRFILCFLLSATTLYGNAQLPEFGNHAAIYLVRHAEKLSGADPLLTDHGNKRAGDLARTLKAANIQRIFVTEYRRTQNTGDSLRILLGIDTIHYLSDTSCTDLFHKIKTSGSLNNSILIIGHSNTIPVIIQKLGITEYPRDFIPDNEFDNLFLVTFKNGKPSLKKTKYGSPSTPSATMQ